MDEVGSTTQSPLITAPDTRESDPEVDGDGVIIDNSSMSSSRTRSGGSRSGPTGASAAGGASRTQATPPASANGTTAQDDAKSEGATDPASDADQGPPLPADGIGGRPSISEPLRRPASTWAAALALASAIRSGVRTKPSRGLPLSPMPR